MVSREEWKKGQPEEAKHWKGSEPNDHPNEMILWGELHGQVVGYAYWLGLEADYLIDPNHNYQNYSKDYYKDKRYDLQGKSVVDIGGGPTSLLLRCKNFSRAIVVDPLPVTDAVKARYEECGIELVQLPAEDFIYPEKVDESWCYNCLHHVFDPEPILNKMKLFSRKLRIFEALNTNKDIMHPHSYPIGYFDKILGTGGTTTDLNRPGPSPRGIGYYGIFNYA